MKLNQWIIGASAATVAVFSWNLLGASRNEAAPVASDGRVETAEPDIAHLARRARTAQRRVNPLAPTWDSSAAAPAPQRAGDIDGEAVAEEHVPPDEPETLPLEVLLEQAFDQETEVIEWTRTAADEATDALSGVLPDGSSLDRVQCRGSLCRVEIKHDTAGGHDEFTDLLMHTPPRWLGPGSYSHVRGTSGEETTLAFLGRPGSDYEEGSIWGAPARP